MATASTSTSASASASTPAPVTPAPATPVLDWIAGRATPAPGAAATEALGGIVGDATVVALGEATRFAHEIADLRHHLLRALVEEFGFRALALEEDWTKGQQLDAYVRTGRGDPRALLDDDAWKVWHTEEFVATLEWIRAHNAAHPDDPVRIVGIDHARVQATAYDTVLRGVRASAPPAVTEEVERHYALLRPSGTVSEHLAQVAAHPDRAQLAARARRVRDLTAALSDEETAWNARVVAASYDEYADPEQGHPDEELMADGILRWHRKTGARIVYWGGTGHTAAHRGRATTGKERTEGALLHAHLGDAYRSIAVTFTRGQLLWPVAPSSPQLAESVLDSDRLPGTFLLDLRHGPDETPPPEVTDWLTTPTRTRVIGPHYDAAADADFSLGGDTFAHWFDAVAHIREVTPVTFLDAA